MRERVIGFWKQLCCAWHLGLIIRSHGKILLRLLIFNQSWLDVMLRLITLYYIVISFAHSHGRSWWKINEHDCISNHRRLDCSLNCLLRRRSKKTSRLRVTGLCEGNSPMTGELSVQRASNEENVFIWWRYHELFPWDATICDLFVVSRAHFFTSGHVKTVSATHWMNMFDMEMYTYINSIRYAAMLFTWKLTFQAPPY